MSNSLFLPKKYLIRSNCRIIGLFDLFTENKSSLNKQVYWTYFFLRENDPVPRYFVTCLFTGSK